MGVSTKKCKYCGNVLKELDGVYICESCHKRFKPKGSIASPTAVKPNVTAPTEAKANATVPNAEKPIDVAPTADKAKDSEFGQVMTKGAALVPPQKNRQRCYGQRKSFF